MKAFREKISFQRNQTWSFEVEEKSGYLYKLSSQNLLRLEVWKRRYCILSKGKIHYFRKKPRNSDQPVSGVISLEHYDICNGSSQEPKLKGFVFILCRNNDLYTGKDRYLFAAESEEEMKDWLHRISKTPKRASAKSSAEGVEHGQTRCGQLFSCTSNASSSYPYIASQGAPMSSSEGDLRKESLYCITKYRAKGPKGRRLPTRKSLAASASSAAARNSEIPRSSSLSALEEESKLETSILLDGPKCSPLPSRSNPDMTYRYSSSDDSEDQESKIFGDDKCLLLPPASGESRDQEIPSSVSPLQGDFLLSSSLGEDAVNVQIPEEQVRSSSPKANQPENIKLADILTNLSTRVSEMMHFLENFKSRVHAEVKVLHASNQEACAKDILHQRELASMKNRISNVYQELQMLQAETVSTLQSMEPLQAIMKEEDSSEISSSNAPAVKNKPIHCESSDSEI